MSMISVGLVINSIDPGGAQIHILNYINTLRKTGKFKFTVLYFESKQIELKTKFHSLSIDTIFLNSRTKLDRFLLIYNHLKKSNYDVIHSHMNRSNLIVIFAAFLAGIKKRISHSHSSIPINKHLEMIKQRIIALLLFTFSTNLLACSSKSGIYLYGKFVKSGKFSIVYNGVSPQKFYFSIENRKKIRLKLGIHEDCFLIGHVGDFSENKNRSFIKLISKVNPINKINTHFLFIGGANNLFDTYNSENFTLIETLDNSVMSEYYSAMDLLLLPSLYEGIPYTIIESQFNGLKSIISDSVDKSVVFTEYVTTLELNDINQWIRKILSIYKSETNRSHKFITNENYYIEFSSSTLIEIYSNNSD